MTQIMQIVNNLNLRFTFSDEISFNDNFSNNNNNKNEDRKIQN